MEKGKELLSMDLNGRVLALCTFGLRTAMTRRHALMDVGPLLQLSTYRHRKAPPSSFIKRNIVIGILIMKA